MTIEELSFWDEWLQLLPLYLNFRSLVQDQYSDVEIHVLGDRIEYGADPSFAAVFRPSEDSADEISASVRVAFTLDRQVTDPKIIACEECGSGKWMHHVLVKDEGDLSGKLMRWIGEAYDLSAEG